MAKVVIPKDYSSRSTIEILAKWNNVDVTITESETETLPTLEIGENKVFGIPAIAGLLCRSSKNGKNWAKLTLGDGVDSKAAAIAQFIDIADSAARGTSGVPMMSTIGSVSRHLKTRCFLAGENLTAADVVMYCTLYKDVSEMNQKDMGALCDVCRWMAYVHSLLNDPFPPLKLHLTPFNHKAAAKKQAKGEGKKEGQQQQQKQQNAGQQQQQQQKGEGKKAKKEKKPQPPKEPEVVYDSASYLDVRVGKIIKIEPHPGADALYAEEIDIGGGVIKKVITGVRKFVPIEQMQDRHVVVICNMKPSKIRGLPSDGMVCAGSNEEHTIVELLDPPANTPIGTRVLFGDFCKCDPVPVDKKGKLWQDVVPHCRIDENGVATYKGQPLHVAEGEIKVPTLRNVEFH